MTLWTGAILGASVVLIACDIWVIIMIVREFFTHRRGD
jgi:hypothetical protein